MKNPDILTQSEFQSRIIPISFNGYEKKVMPAGSPVNDKGEFANDGSAIGILLDDVTREYPYGEAIISGFVDYEVAQNHAQITFSKECMTALKNIVFDGVGDKWIEAGGGVTSWNDLTDKPFKAELPVTVVLSSTTIEDRNGYSVEFNEQLIEGETYTVVYNGKIYTCVAAYKNFAILHLGNYSGYMMPSYWSQGEPFCIWNNTIYAMSYPCTVAVYKGAPSITTLDEIFLPESVMKKSEHTWGNLSNKPFYEEDVTYFTLNNVNFTSNSMRFSPMVPNLINTVGTKYTVNFDGVDYEAVVEATASNPQLVSEPITITNFDSNLISFGVSFFNLSEGIELGVHSIILKGTVVHRLDPKYIPSSVITEDTLTGKLAEAHTWENLPDKPFYDEDVTESIVDEVSLQANTEYDGQLCDLAKGDKLIVEFDGKKYECAVCYGYQSLGLNLMFEYIICEPNYAAEYSGYNNYGSYFLAQDKCPFLIRSGGYRDMGGNPSGPGVTTWDYKLVTANSNDTSEHTISISKVTGTEPVPLDKKYLPTHTHKWEQIEDKPFGEEVDVPLLNKYRGYMVWEIGDIGDGTDAECSTTVTMPAEKFVDFVEGMVCHVTYSSEVEGISYKFEDDVIVNSNGALVFKMDGSLTARVTAENGEYILRSYTYATPGDLLVSDTDFALTITSKEVTKLDPKFLPDVPVFATFDDSVSDGEKALISPDYETVANALAAKKPIQACVYISLYGALHSVDMMRRASINDTSCIHISWYIGSAAFDLYVDENGNRFNTLSN